MRIIALVGLSCALLGNSAVIGLSSAAAAQTARPVAGPVRGTGTPAASPGDQCFNTFPNCTSGDPGVAFTMNSDGDSTGCVFQQDTEWGDSSHTTLSYNGGPNGTALVTFQHVYSGPGVYQISSTIVVQSGPSSCQGGAPFSLQFTLPAPPPVTCQSAQTSIPAVAVPVKLPASSLSLSYGPTPLSFPAGTTSGGSLCTMRSTASVMPVSIDVPTAAPISIASIGSTDTVEFHTASKAAIGVPNCSFAALQALTSTGVTPPFSDFAGTDNCLLTPTFHANWDVVAKLSSPGFTVTTRSAATGKQVPLYSTGPVTYYVDLDTMPNSPGSSASFTQTMQALESFIRSTLLQNIPVIDKIALFQVTPDRSQVADPLGRLVGIGKVTKVTHTFPGAGYAKAAGRSVAWILEPIPGTFQDTIRGKARSKYQADFTILELLGHGENPIVKNISEKASLGAAGSAVVKVPEAGQADVPVPQPHESHTRVAKNAKITFDLAHSVIPFGPGTMTWSFGDGAKATGTKVTHSYKRAGHFVPEVTVTNALGYSVTTQLHEVVVTG